MNEIREDCEKKGYSKALTDFIISFSEKVPEVYLKRAKDAIKSAIIHVTDDDSFNKVVSDIVLDELGYEYNPSTQSYVDCSLNGVYFPVIDFSNNSIKRNIVVKVSNEDILSKEDEKTLLHQLFHLFRSYSSSPITSDDNNMIVHSGVIKTEVPIDKKMDYEHSDKENVSCEESFIEFLVNYFDMRDDLKGIDELLLKEFWCYLGSETFTKMSLSEQSEQLLLYLNLLVIYAVYNNDLMSSLFTNKVDFLSEMGNITTSDTLAFSRLYDNLNDGKVLKDEVRSVAIQGRHANG